MLLEYFYVNYMIILVSCFLLITVSAEKLLLYKIISEIF